LLTTKLILLRACLWYLVTPGQWCARAPVSWRGRGNRKEGSRENGGWEEGLGTGKGEEEGKGKTSGRREEEERTCRKGGGGEWNEGRVERLKCRWGAARGRKGRERER
jgi:hypothetical protein